MKKISIIIPVFRNENALSITYKQIADLFQSELKNYDYEFIFVDDGSDDNSFNELIELREKDVKVKVICFSRNFGQVPAIIAGCRAASGDLGISLSADLQEPVEMIPQMVREYENGSDVVICYRKTRNDGLLREFTSNIFYKLIRTSNPLVPNGGFDFFLLEKKAMAELNNLNERHRFFQGDILWLGFSVKFLPYDRLKRTIGKSQWSLSKRIKGFIDGILNTCYWPIRMMSLLGLLFAFSGFGYAVFIAYARFINKTPFIGYAPIIITILIVGGLLMLMLGIISEYIWRIFDEVKKRPSYIIKEKYL